MFFITFSANCIIATMILVWMQAPAAIGSDCYDLLYEMRIFAIGFDQESKLYVLIDDVVFLGTLSDYDEKRHTISIGNAYPVTDTWPELPTNYTQYDDGAFMQATNIEYYLVLAEFNLNRKNYFYHSLKYPYHTFATKVESKLNLGRKRLKERDFHFVSSMTNSEEVALRITDNSLCLYELKRKNFPQFDSENGPFDYVIPSNSKPIGCAEMLETNLYMIRAFGTGRNYYLLDSWHRTVHVYDHSMNKVIPTKDFEDFFRCKTSWSWLIFGTLSIFAFVGGICYIILRVWRSEQGEIAAGEGNKQQQLRENKMPKENDASFLLDTKPMVSSPNTGISIPNDTTLSATSASSATPILVIHKTNLDNNNDNGSSMISKTPLSPTQHYQEFARNTQYSKMKVMKTVPSPPLTLSKHKSKQILVKSFGNRLLRKHKNIKT